MDGKQSIISKTWLTSNKHTELVNRISERTVVSAARQSGKTRYFHEKFGGNVHAGWDTGITEEQMVKIKRQFETAFDHHNFGDRSSTPTQTFYNEYVQTPNTTEPCEPCSE